MNSKLFNLILIALFSACGFTANAVVAVESLPVEKSELSKQGTNEIVLLNQQQKSKKEFRIVNRTKRLVKRFLKKNNSFGSVFASRKFRLGALLLLLGIIGAIMINIFSLAQIFGWIAGVMGVVGLVLMIWSLIEHSGLV